MRTIPSPETDPEEFDGIADQWLAFLRQLEPLKHLPRSGWVDREVEGPESVGAHSWRLALLAWMVAEDAGLDANYAMLLALMHDVPEAVTGDHTPFDVLADSAEERRQLAANPPAHDQWHDPDAHARKIQAERQALATILSSSAPAKAQRLTALWEDYAAGSSAEARLVHQLDKLEAYLQGWEYADDGRLTCPATLRSFQVDTERQATLPAARALLRAIKAWTRAEERLADPDAPTPE